MTRFSKLDRGWSFRRNDQQEWSQVDLPHSPFVADLNGRDHWFGECDYRRTLQVVSPVTGERHVLYVGAAMHTAHVLIDGAEVAKHEGGYLPFEVDLTDWLKTGAARLLTLRIDNRDNPDIPPGKPYADLDFCWYGGLYRDVELRTYPALHITDANSADEIGGGGVFVRTLSATSSEAVVEVKTHIRNAGDLPCDVQVEVALVKDGVIAGNSRGNFLKIAAGSSTHVDLQLTVREPKLWSPDSPNLYHVRIMLRAPDGAAIDSREVRIGIRRIAFSRSGGFVINGRQLRLRGTNRHQEYPHAGYAVPRAAQVRDARRIKEAGFDYVRLSHYPQSSDFLDACDELGIVVMDAIPGWQFIGGNQFREACFANARQLIRRDRNHPSIVLWELSLNETDMDETFMEQLHRIGHEEYPGDQMFTCGWKDRYDVYIHSRQHGEIHRWQNGDKALVIAEYGDWEFYAANEGFDQKTGAGVHAAWSSSRQFRGDGERGLRQQADNHIIALNDTMASPAVLDGQWSVFDYARGYHPMRAACGVMDIFRLPKFSYYFYRSQRHAFEGAANWTGGPMVFIASHWTTASNLRVMVFSNCDEVELRLNGRVLSRQKNASAWMTQHLPHPSFYFDVEKFSPGTLEAVGFSTGKACATHSIATPGAAAKIELAVDDMGILARPNEPDLLIVHARICDERGQLCCDEGSEVLFSVEGGAGLLLPASVKAEAGIASAVVCLPVGVQSFVLKAERLTSGKPIVITGRWQQGMLRPVSGLSLQPA